MHRLLLVVLVPSFALAQHWEVNSVTGTFGSADAACREALRDHPTLEFVGPARKREGKEDPDRIFRECWVRIKGESTADGGNAPSMHTLAWFTPAKDDEPADDDKEDEKKADKKKEGCGPGTDFSWFPSLEKSALKSSGAGVVPDTKAGSCMLKSQSAGGRLFSGSKTKVRADRMKKETQPVGEHYYLKHQSLIIDPTFLQFFRVHDLPGLVFVGTDAQLIQAADKLYALCGAEPATNDAKNGADFKAANFDGAKLCNAGATLVLRASGVGEYANTSCDP